MFSRALQNAMGKSLILRNKTQSLNRLASLHSTDVIKCSENSEKPENTENSDKVEQPDKSKLRFRLSLRRQKLLPYPIIEKIRTLNKERFMPENFKTVQHGDHEFQVCLEDYVQIYTSGYQLPRPPGACGGYAVYYGENHPLNESGSIERRQALHHAKLYGVLRALKSIPFDLFSKVSLNTDDLHMTKYLSDHLRNMSENSFRSTYSGRLNKDLDTSMEINNLLRTRQDLTFRVQYTPNDISFPPAIYALKMAKNAADDAQRQLRKMHWDEKI